MVTTTRKGASKTSDISPKVKAALEAGTMESATLVEGLCIDFVKLLGNTYPELKRDVKKAMDPKLGITKRMVIAGELLHEFKGDAVLDELYEHPSDTVRGWAAFVIPNIPNQSLKQQLTRIRRLANDAHFGVREWAWLALRPGIVDDPETAIKLLTPWVKNRTPNLRRFAVEATRPRGVWGSHIKLFKSNPELALPLLEPLVNESNRYVQDSVANWLNDAGKTQPQWVKSHCKRMRKESDSPATQYIIKRALRNLK